MAYVRVWKEETYYALHTIYLDQTKYILAIQINMQNIFPIRQYTLLLILSSLSALFLLLCQLHMHHIHSLFSLFNSCMQIAAGGVWMFRELWNPIQQPF